MGQKLLSLHYQSAVIPYRVHQGQVELLLITSIRRGRWIIPKGLIEPDLSPAESACKEAWEEAGVTGRVDENPLGSYQFRKSGRTWSVIVFLLQVQTVHERWPEQFQRRRRWLPVSQAVKVVRGPGLRDLIRLAPTQMAGET